MKQLVAELREGKKSLDDALADAAQRALLAPRMARYLDFAAGFAPAAPPTSGSLGAPARRAERARGAPRRPQHHLLAADDDDQGKLRVGMRQIARAFADVRRASSCSRSATTRSAAAGCSIEPKIEPGLKEHAHALLTGHVHVANAEESRSGAGAAFLRVVAGSAHGDRCRRGSPRATATASARSCAATTARFTRGSPRANGPRTERDRLSPPTSTTCRGRRTPIIRSRDCALGRPGEALHRGAAPPAHLPSRSRGRAHSRVHLGRSRDDAARVELQNHLVQLRRSKKITFKHSQEIPPGGEKPGGSPSASRRPRIIFLLISQEYIAADSTTKTSSSAPSSGTAGAR